MTNRAASAPSRTLTRREFLAWTVVAAVSGHVPGAAHAAEGDTRSFRLRAAKREVQLAPAPYPETPVWCYDGAVPGPSIRVRQGQRLRVLVENALDEETTVHWHGVRVPNAMDGVPHLTQAPIGVGGSFVYEFDAVDAGTFWYHPHHRSSEQVGRGLYGPLIVEEHSPLRVDRDLTWVLDDWRLTRSAEISGDFDNRHDMSHGGRIGNTVTINGQVPETFAVRAGERIRLRLVNAANARIFGLDFAGHKPVVIALDGQPVSPHAPEGGRVVLGPAMRVDLILDMTAKAGSKATVTDRFYERLEYRLVDLVYEDTALRKAAPDWPLDLPANPLPEPDPARASRHEIVFNGGMMGGMMMQGRSDDRARGMMRDMGSMMQRMRSGSIWTINGVSGSGHVMEPMLALERDKSHVLVMANDTAWHHPMHLHGHSFRVISRNGRPTRDLEWQDTVLINPREKVEVAFVADNPGDWMFHCHVLEHQAAGMAGVIRVL